VTRNSRIGRLVLVSRPLSLMVSLLLASCGGEPSSASGGRSPAVDPPATSATPDSAWMDVEPGLTASGPSGSEETGRAVPAQAEASPAESAAQESTPADAAFAVEAPAVQAQDPAPAQVFPAPSATTGDGRLVARLVLPEEPLVFARPEAVRGIYLNGWASGSRRRTKSAIALATRTEVNSFVIDLKDATGYVSHPTQVMFAREVGADQEIRIRDLVGLLERLHEADIYPIARIVIVKDPLLAARRPDLAVQDTAGGVWVDGKGLVWSNMFDSDVWDYHIALAKEAIAVGFPEIQWDYLRFPDAPEEELNRAWYPGQGPRRRTEAVREFLEYAREKLGDVAMTADVFGVTTSARTDVGIGQLWEEFIGVMDVALPMVYPSHYWVGSFGIQDPNGHPYEIVRRALTDAGRRSAAVEGAGTTRPWLQDFTLGAPAYGAPEVRAQIQATYDAGVDEWILWNPSSRYSEAALAPADGYPEGVEPTIRVGGQLVPVSQRETAIEAERMAEETAKAEAKADAEAGDGVPDVVAADTAQIGR
jgi:hypothetical protein